MKRLVLISVLVAGSLAWSLGWGKIEAAETGIQELDDTVYLEFLELKKEKNGQVSQAFAIRLPAPHPHHRAGPGKKTGQKTDQNSGQKPGQKSAAEIKVLFRENQNPEWYFVPITGTTFSISVNRYSHIRLFVVVSDPSATHVIHTDLMLFGKSDTPAQRHPASPSDAARLTSLPQIRLMDAQNYYWHETGVPLTFYLHPKDTDSPDADTRLSGLTVRSKGFKDPEIYLPEPDGERPAHFVYTPPHDPYLRQAGSTAARQDLIFTRIRRNRILYHLTYVLQVHRSRHAHDDHRAGFAVLGISLLVFTGMALIKRRRPWWSASG
ncbi:MAG: hypothetical protein MI862_04410 [Desulfobacterales bacterium]|nr:hypothetical protein [Desulfobacterales bacterium]